MKLKNLLMPFVAITTLLLAVSCKDKNQEQPDSKVTISISGVSSVQEGSSITLTAKLNPTTSKETITWSSSNESIATVSNGKVTGVKAGTATITASISSGAKATHKVTVTAKSNDKKGTTISLDVPSKSIKVGDTFTLKATLAPADAKDEITWESSNKDVASVVKGKVTALKEGNSTITAKLANGNKAECKVSVTAKNNGGDKPTPPPATGSFRFKKDPIVMTLGVDFNIKDEITFDQPLAQDATLTYDEIIQEGGYYKKALTIKTDGTATPLRLTKNTKEEKCQIKVTRSDTKESIIGNVVIEPKKVTLPEGAKIIVSGGGVENVGKVIVTLEDSFELTPKIVDAKGVEIPNIDIAKELNTELLSIDFSNANKYTVSYYDENKPVDTEIKFSVMGTNVQHIVKVNISAKNKWGAQYEKSQK